MPASREEVVIMNVFSGVPHLHRGDTSVAEEDPRSGRASIDGLVYLVAWSAWVYDVWDTVSPARLLMRRLDQIRMQEYDLGRRAERARLGLDPDGVECPSNTSRRKPSRGHLHLV
jgi:hypothetical protein